jgi:hypothetical protein
MERPFDVNGAPFSQYSNHKNRKMTKSMKKNVLDQLSSSCLPLRQFAVGTPAMGLRTGDIGMSGGDDDLDARSGHMKRIDRDGTG